MSKRAEYARIRQATIFPQLIGQEPGPLQVGCAGHVPGTSLEIIRSKVGKTRVIIMTRTDLVVRMDAVTTLQIPALAVTNGAADPDWVEVPLARWRFKRQPSLRLPLDPRGAKKTRRFLRLAPWSPLPAVVSLVAWSDLLFGHLSRPEFPVVVAGGVSVTWLLLQARGLLRQQPYRTRFGDLRIPQVPVEVAQQWVAQNPGVSATDEPAPRPYSRRFYAVWSVCLLLAAVGLGAVLTNDGQQDFFLLWMLVPVLFFTGVSMALKTQPPAKPGIGLIWRS